MTLRISPLFFKNKKLFGSYLEITKGSFIGQAGVSIKLGVYNLAISNLGSLISIFTFHSTFIHEKSNLMLS
jgi:hypothetical protein